MVGLRVPVATYRLQFNRQFRFEDARSIVPYLHRLGISDLYASPVLKARRRSSHGYDVTDPSRLNPELGTERDFQRLAQELKVRGLGFLLDIVPNHMAASPENPWWMDVLENGPCSPYASFFDVDWHPTDSTINNKVLLPVLDSPYGQALRNQELALTLENNGLLVRYRDLKYPLDVKSYAPVLSYRLDRLEAALCAGNPAFNQLKGLIEAMERWPSCFDPAASVAALQQRQALKRELGQLLNSSPEVQSFLLDNIACFNGKKGDRRSFDLLDRLLAQQVYQFAYWKTARGEINYRRFFDISDLVGVRVELPHAFEASHSLIFQLSREGKVTGLRIDHIDGLRDPLDYLRQLQHRLVSDAPEDARALGFYVVVEKILGSDEALPDDWPVFGTTGYDFLNALNGLFVDARGLQDLDTIYSRFIGADLAFDDVVYERKKQVMEELFAGEINALGHHLERLAQQEPFAFDLTQRELTRALIEVTACLPVYRSYTRDLQVSPRDRMHLEEAIEKVRRRGIAVESGAMEFLKRVLLLDFPNDLPLEGKEAWLQFVMRWQQFTGPMMAKGFEDTALYAYNRLVSLNEVGGDPAASDLSVEAFHQRNLDRQTRWPYSLSATATHDTKRGEDVRAKINVLSEMPETWRRCLNRWSRWNHAKRCRAKGQLIPDPNMETFLYQTLVGAWPLSHDELPAFGERMRQYVVKAAREAKAFTSWLSPSPEYESGLLTFVESVLETSDENRFVGDLRRFQKRVAYSGALNALAQVLVKIASPGVPDFYQGTELWDFSLVDPDNRRPVDFEMRMMLLDDIIQREADARLSLVRELLRSWQDGRIKLYVTYKALHTRNVYRDLFLSGTYIPIEAQGQRQGHVCAFARRWGTKWVLIVVPRLVTRLVRVGTPPVGRRVWGDDVLLLPEEAPERWFHTFTGETIRAIQPMKELPLATVFRRFPVALLEGFA